MARPGRIPQKGTTARRPPRPQLAILSRKKSLYSTRRVGEAAKARGLKPRVIDILQCNLVLETGRPRLFVGGKELTGLAAGVPRIGARVTAHGVNVVRQVEALGGRPLELVVEPVGGLPAILKLIQGTQGVGVMIAHSMSEVESILSTLQDLGQEILLQEFVAESRGRDVRALVVGDRVVGAMRREAQQGQFRSNLHRGGEGTALELSREFAEMAVRAARVLGLAVAGVDLLEAKGGPRGMEVNWSPGLQGVESATGKDVAGAIIEYARQLAGLEALETL